MLRLGFLPLLFKALFFNLLGAQTDWLKMNNQGLFYDQGQR